MTPVFLGDVAISPDGKRLAFLEFENGMSRIRVAPSDGRAPDAAAQPPIELGALRAIWIDWVNNDRLAVGTVVWSSLNQYATLPFVRVTTISPDGSDRAILFQNAREFAWNVDLSGLVHPLPDDPKHILMSAGDAARAQNLYLVDVYTGAASLRERGTQATAVWLADVNGKPRIRVDEPQAARLRKIFAKPPGAANWSQIAQYAANSAPPLSLLSASEDPNIVVLKSTSRHDKAGLFKYDLRTNRLTGRVYQREDYDVEGPVAAPQTRLPVGAQYFAVKSEIAFFDRQRRAALGTALARLGPDTSVLELDSDRSERKFIARVESPQDPGSFYLLDLDGKATRLVGRMRPGLSATDLSPVTHYTYSARDGLEIPAYLTVPRELGEPEPAADRHAPWRAGGARCAQLR